MKILNLFAGIGGNRTLWGNDHEITAVENNQQIAMIYFRRFPKDKVIVGDAYEYFLENFQNFDFVWASPPCQSHTILTNLNVGIRYKKIRKVKLRLPDLRLYSLILFCKSHFRGSWVIENVSGYYKPLIRPTIIGRHWIWTNLPISQKRKLQSEILLQCDLEQLCILRNINYELLSKVIMPGIDKRQIVKNLVNPKFGKYILDSINTKTLEAFL